MIELMYVHVVNGPDRSRELPVLSIANAWEIRTFDAIVMLKVDERRLQERHSFGL